MSFGLKECSNTDKRLSRKQLFFAVIICFQKLKNFKLLKVRLDYFVLRVIIKLVSKNEKK